MADIHDPRAHFNETVAPALAEQVGARRRWVGESSSRFSYFTSKTRFVVVAGPQEGSNTDLALAFGLSYRSDLRLTLILPKGYEFPTLQRSAWLDRSARPHVYVHSAGRVAQTIVPTKGDTIEEFENRFGCLSEELRDATAPAHLGRRSAAVTELVDWATANDCLDPSHRRGERAWQCLGQRVLSIKRSRSGIAVTAGIHYSKEDEKPEPALVLDGDRLGGARLQQIKAAVNDGISERLKGKLHRADEHWLQAVIRRNPTLLGVEQPALREMPAWRPAGSPDPQKRWGRGYIDLLGVDGSGDLRLVETKLSANSDPMLIFQGLDYYIWSQAYLELLRSRLGAPKRSQIVLHYVIGADEAGSAHVNPYNRRQIEALVPDIRWVFQVVKGWQADPFPGTSVPTANVLPPGKIPAASNQADD